MLNSHFTAGLVFGPGYALVIVAAVAARSLFTVPHPPWTWSRYGTWFVYSWTVAAVSVVAWMFVWHPDPLAATGAGESLVLAVTVTTGMIASRRRRNRSVAVRQPYPGGFLPEQPRPAPCGSAQPSGPADARCAGLCRRQFSRAPGGEEESVPRTAGETILPRPRPGGGRSEEARRA